MKEKNRKRARRIQIRIILLFITLIIILVSTYTWLISYRTVTVISFDVEIPMGDAGNLFNLKNQYIGDASANTYLLEALGISKLGDYTIELKTEEEPYALIINFSSIKVELKEFHTKMRNYSFVLLALIDNADEIHYSINNEEINSIKIDEVNELYGNIKEYGESIEKLDSLLTEIGF